MGFVFVRSALAVGLMVCLLFSCNQQQTVQGCYIGTVAQDSVFLSIQTNEDRSNGTLTYQFLEKDNNIGTVEGQLLGDTLLLLEYAFISEGRESERQIAFLLRENTLLEGYGEMEDQNGRMRFADLDKLNFGSGFVLHKTDCHLLPQ